VTSGSSESVSPVDGGPRGSDEISPVELIFDLVFVFAVSQLSQHFLQDVNWRGAAETAVLLAAAFSVWAYTAFEATLVHVGRRHTQWVLLAVMWVGLFMNAAINRAFTDEPWAFVVPFLVVQLGRPIWTIVTAPRELQAHYVGMLGWLVASAPLWVVGGVGGGTWRLVWWAIAAVLDMTGTWLAHPIPGRVFRSENIEFDAAHLVERCRLFLLIALGEVVVTTGTAVAEVPSRPMAFLTGSCALAIPVALWALYFAGSDHLVNRHVERTTNPILAGRLTLSSEGLVVAGLIALAVGCQLVILHPLADTGASLTLLLFGGPLLYLLVQTGYLWLVTHNRSSARLVGIAALVAGGGLAVLVPAYAAIAVAAAIVSALVAAVFWENRASGLAPP